MMRIYVNVERLGHTPTGIHRYFTEVLHYLIPRYELVPVSFTSLDDGEKINRHLHEEFGLGPVTEPVYRLPLIGVRAGLKGWNKRFQIRQEAYLNRKGIWTRFLRELHRPFKRFEQCLIKWSKVDFPDDETVVVFSPFEAVPPAYHAPSAVVVQMLHDIIPIRFPSLYGGPAYYESVVNSALRADLLLVNSSFTRDDFLDCFPQADPERMVVTELAAARHFSPVRSPETLSEVKRRHGIDGAGYVLTLGTIEPRKNHLRLLQAWSCIQKEFGERNIKLVIVGWGGMVAEFHQKLADQVENMDSVVLLGYVSDADLSALYGGALFSVYPSLYEGFGLPVLESMACGKFCLTSNTSSMPEVVGQGLPMVDPTDSNDISDKMLDLLKNPNQLETYHELALRKAECFSWEETGRKTVEAIQAAVSRKSQRR